MAEESEKVAASQQSTINEAVEKAILIALQYGDVSRGLKESIKALESEDGLVLILAKDNDEPLYVQTLTALANEKDVPILKVDSKMELGRASRFCKYDIEGKPRKIVKCSSVVIKSWGRESNAREMIMQEIEKTN
ncbi:40S ribosomal protein S12 [Bonamia ostreae]|uniref:40S ribosomal protein S12 n=1 Tax=Bonamia ostreae TaxID=126728 RepID=A0ABV2AHV4_9EUKA